jgi:hypothetical protein
MIFEIDENRFKVFESISYKKRYLNGYIIEIEIPEIKIKTEVFQLLKFLIKINNIFIIFFILIFLFIKLMQVQ